MGFILTILFWFNHFLIPGYIVKVRSSNEGQPAVRCLQEKELITFTSEDQLEIKAYLNHVSTSEIIILIHGIRSNAATFCSLQKRFESINISSIAIDLRAHGSSEGQYCTFGAKEKYDIKLLVDQLEERGYQKIGVLGQSLGGAVALQAMEIDNRIAYGIIESTFSDWRTVVKDYIQNYLYFRWGFISDYWINRAASRAGFTPSDVVPKETCKNIKQPILMVHGANDSKIDMEHGKINFSNLPGNKKQFVAVPEAGHDNVHRVGGVKLWKTIEKFLEEN